jgi:hypothetical protein
MTAPEHWSNWRKSSYSGTTNGDCVEVAMNPDAVGVRDSKNTAGPILELAPATWRALLSGARRAPRR